MLENFCQINYKLHAVPHKELSKSTIDNQAGTVKLYFDKFNKSSIFSPMCSDTLMHMFTEIAEAHEDLLNYYSRGEENVSKYIQYAYHETSSTNIVVRKVNIKTFASTSNQDKSKAVMRANEKEQKQQIAFLKRLAIFSNKTNTAVGKLGQMNTLPLAIAQSNGQPYHGTKSAAFQFYAARYKKGIPNMITSSFPEPVECIILDAMFLLNLWCAVCACLV